MSYILFIIAPFCISPVLARPNPTLNARQAPAAPVSSPTSRSGPYSTVNYEAEISQFFRTAAPTARAEVSSDLALQRSWDAAISEYLTYTGTSDIFGLEAVPTNQSAIYASASKVYVAELSAFFRTAEPTAKAAVSSELAAQSSLEADLAEYATYTGTSDILGFGAIPTNYSAIYASQTKAYAAEVSQYFRTAAPTAKAALSSDLAAQSSWEAKLGEYLTYTGTSDLLGFSSTKATEPSSRQTAAANTSSMATSGASSSSAGGWPALTLTDKPAAYGVECRNFYDEPESRRRASFCASPIQQICQLLHQANTGSSKRMKSRQIDFPLQFTAPESTPPEAPPEAGDGLSTVGETDKWLYTTAAEGQAGPYNRACGAAAYLPQAAVGTTKVPSIEQCEDAIYGTMLGLCGHSVGPDGESYDMARVNVEGGSANYTDSRSETQLGAPYMGRQIDPKAPSFVITF